LSKSLEVYDKSAFMERAKTLPVLPLPRNDRGSKLYEDIIETINKQYDSSKPQFDESNQRVITAGINLALNYQDLKTHEELGQIYTLLSLLYLNAGNYDNSYYYAQHAISEVRIANTDRKSNISITLPHALLAITSLSKGDVDVSWSIDHLKYAIENEKDNDLIPFTLSVFVDRLMLRLDKMKPSHLVRIQNITVRTERKYRTQANQALLVKSLVMTKKEQDFIRIVTSISPESIQCDLAKSKLKTSLNDYSDYLYVAKTCLNDVSSDEKFLKDPENKKPLLDLNRTIGQYEGYHTQLESFVSNYQCKVSVQ